MSKQITISKNKRQEQKPHNPIFRVGLSQDVASDHRKKAHNSTAANCIPINPKGELLTPEKLRSFYGCNHYNAEEALAVIDSLNTLARIILGTAPKPGTPIGNQQILHLDTNTKSYNKAA